ncbi:MAG: PIN domain-containing protein [Verrucomicrobia bacterium]|nr:PIN domain-containing protein [Verrucomicrobiota bacterium]
MLDTSVLIAAEKGQLDLPMLFSAIGEEPAVISAITASELLHGVERARAAGIRARRSRYVEWIINNIGVVAFGIPEARAHARLWAQLSIEGQPIGPYDLVVAATALSLGFSLATLNKQEFNRVSGLDLFTVPV